ncbi:DUF4350 domain-containing protein [Sphingobacterium bovistauri]|uniref:DUF4350 domain-containing protein n=1 Tax=Sphingobacterium bovistauri TaxID=2781959 RepID=A0ABS7Z6Q2_9SPHI|nr:DUF4350 domain-containing protein [Sphingobacterium bovistauri]MCA5005866.1 DUF4350 domain-containing protein [Sphingobacterium bovistauri]
MSKGTWFGVALIVIVFMGIVLIDAGAKRPIDWRESYLFKEKIPFGTYVFREELPNILSKDRKYTDTGDSYYELFYTEDSLAQVNSALIDIYEYHDFYEEQTDALLHYVERGGEVFLSGKSFPDNFLDTLGLYFELLDYAKFRPLPNSVYYTLGRDTSRLYLDKVASFPVFSKLNPETTTILGHLNSRGRALPNFVKVSYGKGALYLHMVPAVFGNYYMLQENSYKYASKVINVINSKDVWLYDYGYNWEQPRTPLRVILNKQGFAQAWYLLLIGLVLLMLFKSKREQRAVPVIKPEPNKSKEFAQTIGNLYYENGSPGNIIQKKIEYFLFDIRNNYQVDTLKLDDDRLIKQLSSKSGVNMEEIKQLLGMVELYRNKREASIHDVKIINQKIEEFKQKANLI